MCEAELFAIPMGSDIFYQIRHKGQVKHVDQNDLCGIPIRVAIDGPNLVQMSAIDAYAAEIRPVYGPARKVLTVPSCACLKSSVEIEVSLFFCAAISLQM